MKIKKFNINILLSLFTLTKVYSMQNQDECYEKNNIDAFVNSIDEKLKNLFQELYNYNDVKREIQIEITFHTEQISISHPFLKYFLEFMNYKKIEEQNIYYMLPIVLCTENQIEQYKIYNKFLMKYLTILAEVILTVRNFDQKIQNSIFSKRIQDNIIENQERIKKIIEDVFKNPEKLNYNTLLAPYNDDNYKITHRVVIKNNLNQEDRLQRSMKENIKIIESEIKKLEIIEENEILKEYSYKNYCKDLYSIANHYNQIKEKYTPRPRDQILKQIFLILSENVIKTLKIQIPFKIHEELHLHPFFQKLLKSINYEKREENNKEMFTNIEICNEKQIEQYKIYNELLIKYLDILLDIISKIKKINNIFKNPTELNNDTLLEIVNFNENSISNKNAICIYDDITLKKIDKKIDKKTGENNKSLEEKMRTIEKEIEKLKIIYFKIQ